MSNRNKTKNTLNFMDAFAPENENYDESKPATPPPDTDEVKRYRLADLLNYKKSLIHLKELKPLKDNFSMIRDEKNNLGFVTYVHERFSESLNPFAVYLAISSCPEFAMLEFSKEDAEKIDSAMFSFRRALEVNHVREFSDNNEGEQSDEGKKERSSVCSRLRRRFKMCCSTSNCVIN